MSAPVFDTEAELLEVDEFEELAELLLEGFEAGFLVFEGLLLALLVAEAEADGAVAELAVAGPTPSDSESPAGRLGEVTGVVALPVGALFTPAPAENEPEAVAAFIPIT
jgi:hypothetical protein